MKRSVTVTFWGTRGSIPTPGPLTLHYGGNTSCVEVRYGRDFLILDAGTGIRLLGIKKFPPSQNGNRPAAIPILITHNHMDHIIGLPFFGPALRKGQRLKIFGPPGIRQSLQRLFPFSILLSRRSIHEIRPGSLRVPPFQVTARWVNHPGKVLAYRILTPPGKTIVYMSDHEPVGFYRHTPQGPSDGELLRWIDRADLLIMDAQYFEEEYLLRRGWGHSPISYAVQIALKARIGHLVLFHHDPVHSDAILTRKLAQIKQLMTKSRLKCTFAREGRQMTL